MLNDVRIKNLCEDKLLVKPFELGNLQSHSLDCRLGDTIKTAQCEFTDHHTSFTKHWVIDNLTEGRYFLQPGTFALASTVEYFNCPPTIAGIVCGKSSIGRNGLQIENAGLIDPGFHGQITLELYNMAPWPIELHANMLICQVYFYDVEKAEINPYMLKASNYCGQKGPTISRL